MLARNEFCVAEGSTLLACISTSFNNAVLVDQLLIPFKKRSLNILKTKRDMKKISGLWKACINANSSPKFWIFIIAL